MKKFAGLFGIMLALWGGVAHAGLKDIYNSNNSGEMEIGFERQKYGETLNDATFDYERGTIPSIGFALNYMPHATRSSWFLRNLYISLQGHVSFGDTKYVGGLCNAFGSCIPWESTTENIIFNFNGRIGHGFVLGDQVMLIPYGDIGFRSWNRKLTGIGGYTEDYTHGTFMAGLLAQYSPAERWVLALGAAGGTTFSPQMVGLGRTFKLGAKPVWQMEAKAGYRVTKHLELTAKGAFSGFDYGDSPVVGGYMEPASSTHNIRMTVGAAYQFAP